jgi:hypothetical protein
MKAKLDLSSRVVRSPEPISAETGGGVVMLSIETGKYFGLNETAQAIWARMEAPVTVAALVQSIQAEFDIDSRRAEAAVLAFVSRLIEEKIASSQA